MMHRSRYIVIGLWVVSAGFVAAALILWVWQRGLFEQIPDVTAELRAEADAVEKERTEALDAALAALPEGVTVSPEDDCFNNLEKWGSSLYSAANIVVEAALQNGGAADDEALSELEETLGPLRAAGKMTELEKALDPQTYTWAQMKDNLRRYLNECDEVQRFEQAVACGVCLLPPLMSVEHNPYAAAYGITLLAARALLDVESGDAERAFSTIMLLLSFPEQTQRYIHHESFVATAYRRSLSALSVLLDTAAPSPFQREQLLDACKATASPDENRQRLHWCLLSWTTWYEAFWREDGLSEVTMSLVWFVASFMSEKPVSTPRDTYEVFKKLESMAGLFDKPPYLNKDALNSLLDGIEASEARYAIEDAEREYRRHWMNRLRAELPGLAFALKDYKEATGAYPETLEELAPE